MLGSSSKAGLQGVKRSRKGQAWVAMEGDVCSRDFNVSDKTYTVRNITFFYDSCFSDRDVIERVADCVVRIETLENEPQCAQFCYEFSTVLPPIYVAISCLSLVCCLGVFATYFSFPRLRQSGYSSRVFLYRYASSLN